jgi:N-methylhydantoinase B
VSAGRDPITLRVVSGALRAACEEMGAVLVKAAHSANIKERRDASCALFDAAGEMVMQAEHIPVHLGAMPDAVAAVAGRDHSGGTPWVLNDPFAGGTHLPDITVITPVLAGGDLLGFAASRAHHADVGGPTPGSMPADSRTLADEGVVIEPQPLDEPAVERLAAQMRQPAQRRADLRAQLAANRTGARRLIELRERLGADGLAAAMEETVAYAERRMRACLAALPEGPREARDRLEATDGDLELRLTATVAGDELRAGLHRLGGAARRQPQLPARRHALGLLVRRARAHGPRHPARRRRDAAGDRPRARGQPAQRPPPGRRGGRQRRETLGGGQGACPDADGPSGVHVAMSNTLNTPVEALELEFPLRVIRYGMRRGSGGEGRQRGGDGVVRELEALAPMRYSLLTERRRHAPPGADGGRPGARGRNLLDGRELAAKAAGSLRPGQRLRIETPGGGGHGG